MVCKTIYDVIDRLAPFALSKEYCKTYSAYDNSGILLDCGEEITGVLFSLDLSKRAVARAKEAGANCIVTHHPAIFRPLHALDACGAGEEVLACARAGISLVSAHLNLDCAQGGIDDCLMNGLGGSRAEQVMHALSQGGYGKLFEVPPCGFEAFVGRVKQEFSAERVVAYGEGRVRRVASFCGAGTDEESVAFALSCGADTFVSSDGKHHLVRELAEKGLNVLLLTHYAAEEYGFKKFYLRCKENLKGVRTEFDSDERFL